MKKEEIVKEEIVSEIGKPLLRPLGIAQGVFFVCFIISPFLWIWGDWSVAWKTGLTGLIGVLLVYFLYKKVHRTVSKSVDEYVEQRKEAESTRQPRGRFEERLHQMKKQNENRN